MIRHTEEVEVHASREDLWEEYLHPQKLEQILPSVENVHDQGDGIYEAEMVFSRFDFHMGVMFETKERRRPEKVHLSAGYPDFDLEALLSDNGATTAVTLTAKLGLPTGLQLIAEDKAEQELQDRMEEKVTSLKREVNGTNG